ncbi:MAG: hypothetical protein PHU06_04980 [Gallionella sp.]|nr:hypothetical protein [Gallionella sp.]MDD4957971.1 hypothetical protein [Gallionella sp.]
MQPISPKMRLLLFLYSTQNLVGCTLAIGGLGLFFSGLIADWWFPIVLGLYAVGWFAVPRDHELELRVRNEATQADLTDSIDELLEQSKAKLPQEAVERLTHIRVMVLELAPKLFSGEMAVNSAISLTNAVTRDLPETVRNYLYLPTAFATLHVIHDGKTCKQLLIEQLDLLNQQLSKIAESIYQEDAEALVINGKFLQEKFHAVSFVG